MHPVWISIQVQLRRAAFASGKSCVAVLLLLATFSPAVAGVTKDDAHEVKPLAWTDIQTLAVEGRGWNDTKDFYNRLPARAEKLVRPAVWKLSLNSAGMLVRFTTDATVIYARWSLKSPNLAMPNMAATGVSGLDLYVKTSSGEWRWAAVGQPREQTNTTVLIDKMSPGTREFMLYLPLFNGVDSVSIGVPTNAVLRRAGPWGKGERKPILFYGTSILNGISASRPGLVHSAMLGRRFNWPTLNFGFSGEGRMEPELADLLAELDPAVYVLDCLPNMGPADVALRVEPFVTRLRQAHPKTPIVLVEDRVYANAFLTPDRAAHHANNHAALRKVFEQLEQSGVKQIYYIPGDHLFGDDGEGSVDGSHPNALGYQRQAEILAKVLQPLLKAN